MILILKTDEFEVYIGLWSEGKEQNAKKWEPGRELSVQILDEINNLCEKLSINVTNLSGVIVYEGPGSYTGLRISVSVANSIGYSNNIPVIGASGINWIGDALIEIKNTDHFSSVSPIYGGEVYTTKPIK
jgi:tRNA threonylcarbamoyladenosine biosynthesis protein TsaB